MAVCFRWFLVLILLAFLPGQFESLIAQTPPPTGFSLSTEELEPHILPRQNNQNLLDREMQLRHMGRAPRFAKSIPVQITPSNQGRWDIIDDRAVWRLRLYSPGAHSLNLGFTQYQMPEGGSLHLYDPQKQEIRGPFTPADNESHNQLWTPVFPGDELIVEIQVPIRRKNKLNIELSFVNHDFLGFGQVSSGSCNLDIVCGITDGWDMVEPFRDVSRSVGVYSIGGTLICTGFLVNNTQQDCTPYFLTADHCGISPDNAGSVVVYWNFENSSCREPDSFASGQDGDGKLDIYNTGAIFRAGWSNADFCLIELDDPVADTANAYFAGWSAEDELPNGQVASIHHPLADEKRISFSDDVTHFGYWGSSEAAENGDHIIINSWSTGTTQSGSSGAPLFNSRGFAIGQLHGGDAACDNESYDSFGRLYSSWEGGGTPDSRLKDWLDPIGLDIRRINGKEQDRCDFSVIGTFTAGNICVGSSDTLNLYFGSGYESVPEIMPGNIAPELDITVESIPDGPDGAIRFAWNTGANTPEGRQQFAIYTTYDNRTDTSFVVLDILTQSPDTPFLSAPADQAEDLGLKVVLEWEPIAIAESYVLQLATTPSFDMPLAESVVVGTNRVILPDLQANTVYYWRVAAENICGLSGWSDAYTFSTGDIQCQQGTVADTPIEISSSTADSISSELELDITGTIVSVEVNMLDIQHDWVGDLSIILRSPSGTETVLIDRPGFPSSLFGCDGPNLQLSFNDETGTSHQELESTCGSFAPAISGTFKPLEPLSGMIGEKAGGTWTLIVKDQADEDGGSLVGWGLSLCTVPEVLPLISGINDNYTLCRNDSLQLELVVSEEFEGESVALTMEPPAPGSAVVFSGNPVSPGDTVTLLLNDLPPAGNYSLALNASDGFTENTFPFGLEVKDIPQGISLDSPSNDASLSDPNITFSWSPVNAASYRLELSSEPEFNNLLQAVDLTAAFYTLELPEQSGTYYWRVVVANECGEITSEVFSFRFSTSAVSVFPDGTQAKVYPNPFSRRVWLEFTQPLDAPLQLNILDTRGRRLFSDRLSPGQLRYQLQLEQLSPGIYLLELDYRGRRFVQRLLKGL